MIPVVLILGGPENTVGARGGLEVLWMEVEVATEDVGEDDAEEPGCMVECSEFTLVAMNGSSCVYWI